MDTDDAVWDAAVAAAAEGLSPPAARQRRRYGRLFAAWCRDRGIEPSRVDRTALEAFLAGLRGTDPQRATKARCDLRAVLHAIDPATAARAARPGVQAHRLAALTGTALGALLEAVVGQPADGARRSARASALGRLLAWCAEVGISPASVVPTDLIQLRDWLDDVGAPAAEVLVTVRAFVELRHSPRGRAVLGEPEPVPRPLRIETRSPLQPRFDLEDVPRFDRVSNLPAPVAYTPAPAGSASREVGRRPRSSAHSVEYCRQRKIRQFEDGPSPPRSEASHQRRSG